MEEIIGVIVKVIPIFICILLILFLINKKEKIKETERAERRKEIFTPKGQRIINENTSLLIDPIHEKFAIASPLDTQIFLNKDLVKYEIVEYGEPILGEKTKAEELMQLLLRKINPSINIGKGKKKSSISSNIILKIYLKQASLIETISNQRLEKSSMDYQQIRKRASLLLEMLDQIKKGDFKQEEKRAQTEVGGKKRLSEELQKKIQKLDKLRADGIISEEEYEETKRRLLNTE